MISRHRRCSSSTYRRGRTSGPRRARGPVGRAPVCPRAVGPVGPAGPVAPVPPRDRRAGAARRRRADRERRPTSSPRRRRCSPRWHGRPRRGRGRRRPARTTARRAADLGAVAQPRVGEVTPSPENPDGMQVSVSPTTGWPAIVVTPVGSGASSTRRRADRDGPRRASTMLPASSSASTDSVLRLPDVTGRRLPAHLERERDLALDELAVHAQAHLLHVAARVVGLDLDLDRVGGVDRRVGARPQPRHLGAAVSATSAAGAPSCGARARRGRSRRSARARSRATPSRASR